jgi:hypothetical protein
MRSCARLPILTSDPNVLGTQSRTSCLNLARRRAQASSRNCVFPRRRWICNLTNGAAHASCVQFITKYVKGRNCSCCGTQTSRLSGDTCAKLVSATTAGVPLHVALHSRRRRILWSCGGFFVCRLCISFTDRKSRLSAAVFCRRRRERSDGMDVHCLAARLSFELIGSCAGP